MHEIPGWRKIAFAIGSAPAVISPLYFLGSVALLNMLHDFKISDKAWGNMVFFGYCGGFVSLLGGLFGKGWPRVVVMIMAALEIPFWMFMAIGL